jgi:hypothetical protein
MRKLTLTLFLLATLPLVAADLGIGVGAKDASHIVVKIGGQDRVVDLKTAAAGEAVQKFLQCLVAGRVLKVGAKGVKLLDGNDVAEHVKEFASTKTSADPCALGRAVYTPQRRRV